MLYGGASGGGGGGECCWEGGGGGGGGGRGGAGGGAVTGTGEVNAECFAKLHAERNEGTKFMAGVQQLNLGKTGGQLSSNAEDGANYNIR